MSDADRPAVRVLVVDSDTDAQRAVRDCLVDAEERLDVVTAGTLSAGVERATDERVDCLVTAGELGDGSGLELIRRVREVDPEMPTVLYPCNGSEELAASAFQEGVDAYRPRQEVTESCERVAGDVLRAVTERTERRAALERMTDGFFAVDTDWRLTYLNYEGWRTIKAAVGEERLPDDLRGERIWDVIPGLDETAFGRLYREAMETQEPVREEVFYEPLDRWYEVRAFPSPTGLSAYFRDVTERKADRRRLERREELLTRMYRVVADKDRSFEEKVGELLAIGREELAVEYGSLSRLEGQEYVFEVVDSADGADGISAGDVAPVSSTLCEQTVAAAETVVVEDLETERPELAERAAVTDLGLECYLGAPVFVDGEVTGTFCFYGTSAREESFSQWEITLVDLMSNWVSYERERKRREEELTRERNRLEEFASIVSHDLRNPLNLATSRLELATDECDSEHLDKVDDALGRMDALIDDVLTLARSGHQVDEESEVPLSAVAEAAWETAGTDVGTLVVEDDLTLVGDRSRFRRLFENLFSNAVEYGVSDGTVTVRVGALDDGFYVADDGPGIPEDEREEVFDHGYSTAADGTGFGLSIVDQIAEAHGGTVSVTDSEAGGARFEIRGIRTRG